MGSNATQPGPRLGDWVTLANNTIYQAATDGTVQAGTTTVAAQPNIKTDSATPPTVTRYTSRRDYAEQWVISKVKKGDYWRAQNCTTVYWIPTEM